MAYGALGNRYFRFFDIRMSSSTTLTGQYILKHQCAETNRLLTNKYELYGDAIIAGDTDSTYFKTYANNKEDAIKISNEVAKKVSKSFPKFMKDVFLCREGFDNIIETGREIVGSSSIFCAKKMYTIRVVDSEGNSVDYLKNMGLSLKKTTLPKELQKVLSDFIHKLLKKEDWDAICKNIVDFKMELSETDDISRIGLPIGVKNVDRYTTEYKLKGIDSKLPGHVAASIHWNEALDENNDKESIRITSGTKIKVFYLKGDWGKYGKFKSIAIPTDTVEIPEWFLTKYKDHIDVKAQLTRLIDKPLSHIFDAIGKKVPTQQMLKHQELVSY